MNRVTLSFFAAICLISSAFGTECSSEPGNRFPITCPGLLDPKKSNCCEIGGSFRCCDEEEFARQDQKYTDNIEPARAPRYKRDDDDIDADTAAAVQAASAIVITLIVFAISSPIFIVCCCFCCTCCPGYIMCHQKPSTVTIIQPSGHPAGQASQNNFSLPPVYHS